VENRIPDEAIPLRPLFLNGVISMMNAASPKLKEENRPNPLLEKAKEVGSQAVGKAKEAMASVGEMASKGVTAVGKEADNLTASAGAGIKKLGDLIGENTPHEGVLGNASQTVAKTLHEGGQYLEDAKLSGLAEDVTQLIKRNPIPAILVGIGVGIGLGLLLRRGLRS
jgi:ElaB/YqjD/DUF883 family membrane-anchored ribosome-binding protein